MSRSTALLTALLLAANLALVGWWTWFQVQQANDLGAAGELLARGDADGAARAFGAGSAAELPAVAAARRRMFLSEGAAFTAVLLLAGLGVVLTVRREARMRADHHRFLAGATHELKTPIATIQLLLESLQQDRLPPDKRARYLQSGLLEAQRLEAGVTNLLTAAGLRGKVSRAAARSDGDLAQDVQKALALLQPRAEAAGVELRATALPSVPILRDPEAIQLVLHNLLDNAVKYSQRGGVVRIELEASAEQALLRVHDDGQGMDGETLEHAFVPFWRGRDSGTGGSGLGLFLVRELVEAHGGTVRAESPGAGRGSSFSVRLPRRLAATGARA
ncbi:MAG: sensor histidine kinase [Planctomycetota bacterium]